MEGRARPAYDVVVLAGGTSRRFRGAAADKLQLTREGRTLIGSVLAQARAATTGTVVAVGLPPTGGTDLPEGITWTREEPPGGGPLAGIAAAAPLLSADVVVLLAGDAPAGPAAAATLVAALAPGHDAAVLVDADGRRATLCAALRTAAVRRRLQQLGDPAGRPARELYAGLAVVDVPDAWQAADDIDTPADAARLGWS